MTHTVTLTPKLQITQPQQPAAPRRPTLSMVLWVKFLRWLENASPHAIKKALLRLAVALTVLALTAAPSWTLGYLTAFLQWNSYRIPLCIAAVALTLRLPTLLKSALRLPRIFRRKGNQHSYHGIPVGALARFLTERGSFKFDEACRTLAISQGQYAKISDELERQGVLMRGEKNARVLRTIEYDMLVTQLRDKFPYAWSEERGEWYERGGAFEQWAVAQDFKRRRLEDDIGRKERRAARLRRKIEAARQSLAPPALLSSQTA